MNILMVDMEKNYVKDNIRRIRDLQDISTNLVGAYSGEEALEVMEYFIPDLMITDVAMPSMNGLTLIDIAKSKHLCEHFIILTSCQDFDYVREAVKYQVMDYLLKPCAWPALENYIRQLALKPNQKYRMMRVMEDYEEFFSVPKQEQVSAHLQKLKRYVNRYCYKNDISLKTLADYSGLSEQSICNLFKKEMGITFLEYLSVCRMKKAAEILMKDEKTEVKEIAQLVGYSSERQFFRVFQKKLHMTPMQFRQKYLY